MTGKPVTVLFSTRIILLAVVLLGVAASLVVNVRLLMQQSSETSSQGRISSLPENTVQSTPEASIERRKHPYMGARDENGNWGYVHDPTYLKKHPLSLTFYPSDGNGTGICDTPYGKGEEGYQGIWALHKIEVVENPPDGAPRVLCIIYSHSNHHSVIEAIAETFGQRCDGFIAASNQTNRTIGAVDIPHQGEETYGNIWQKLRSTWYYVYDNYVNDFDWFFVAGDNTFVIAENLIHACRTVNVSAHEPIYLGQAQGDIRRRRRFCGGGAGYVINRALLKTFIEKFFDTPDCLPDHVGSDEDRIMGHCLRWNVTNCTNSVDEFNENRFHPMDAHYHAMYNKRRPANWDPHGLLEFHNLTAPSKEYLEQVSRTTVSFHLVKYRKAPYGQSPKSKFLDKGLRRYHTIVYNLCKNQDSKTLDPNKDGCQLDKNFPMQSDKKCRAWLNETKTVAS